MSLSPVKSLSEVCEINPRLPRDYEICGSQQVSFVPMAAIDEVAGRIIDRQTRLFAEVRKGYTHFKDDDVLFAKITPCMENGKAAIARDLAGGLGFGSTEFHVLRSRGEVVPEWVFYFVRRQRFREDAKRSFTGTAGQQRVPTTFMEAAKIPVPPLPEQRRLVDILSRAESVVRLRREALKKTQEIIPALFLDMFGDPATNPKEWPTQPLGEIVSLLSGGTPSKAREDFWQGDLPWVSPKDMKVSELNGAIDHVSPKVLTETNIKLVPISSVLIVVRGMILVHTVPVARTMVPLTINQDMKALVPKDSVDGCYLLWALKVLQPQLLNMVSTAAHGTRKLETARLEKLLIPLPLVREQLRFAERAEQIRSMESQAISALATAETTFQSLLHRAFAGEL
jgi:type I restriction enzyme S subunit